MLRVELAPGAANAFAVGQSLRQVLDLVTKHTPGQPVVDIKFDRLAPLSSHILIELQANGILFRFTPDSQRLIAIELCKLDAVQLKYKDVVFDSLRNNSPTYANICRGIAASIPGEFSEDFSKYTLSYPGIAFLFSIPENERELMKKNSESMSFRLEFSDGSSPLASRVLLYYGKSLIDATLPVDNSSLQNKSSLMTSSIISSPVQQTIHSISYFEPIIASQTGILFPFLSRNVCVSVSCVQDVLSDIGHPEEVCYKKDDKMSIHAGFSTQHSYCSDYFYNYYRFGFDILFDGERHFVKKIILHTNLPGHHEFGRYSKANFVVSFDGEIDFEAIKNKPNAISCDSTLDDISNCYPIGKPLVNDQGKSEMPFGPSLFYGVNGIIVEVSENKHIASITIYKSC